MLLMFSEDGLSAHPAGFRWSPLLRGSGFHFPLRTPDISLRISSCILFARTLVSVSFGVVPLPAWHRGTRQSRQHLERSDVVRRATASREIRISVPPGGDGESVALRALFSLFPSIPLHFPASFYNLFKSKNPSLYSLVRHGFIQHGSSSLYSHSLLGPEPLICEARSVHVFFRKN